jgi:mRNA interferase MazF
VRNLSHKNVTRSRERDSATAQVYQCDLGDLPTWVKLSPADPLAGYASADCIEQLGKEELGEHLGSLSPASNAQR